MKKHDDLRDVVSTITGVAGALNYALAALEHAGLTTGMVVMLNQLADAAEHGLALLDDLTEPGEPSNVVEFPDGRQIRKL